MGSATEYNRRDLFKRAAAITVLAAGGTSLLAACAGGSGSGDSASASPTLGGDNKNPFGVKATDKLDVVIFTGGYGDDYAKQFEESYKKAYAGAVVSHLGTQEISGKLQPRFNAGSPPDVFDNSGAQAMKADVLVGADQLTDLTVLLDAPYLDDPTKKIRDVLLPGTIEAGTINGKMYSLSYVYTVFGLWYSAKLFKDKGWAVPKTWDEFITLCGTIKAAGVSPFAHQGKYPYYANYVILSMIAKQGGQDLVKRLNACEAAAWDDPAVLKAVTAFYQIMEKDYLLPGTNGMTHTESQTAWCQGKAAFIPSGSWLENEMLAATPADFDMAFLPIPALAGDKLAATSLWAGAGEPFMVPSKAANKAGGLEFLRMMLTKESSSTFVKAANSLTVLKDGVNPDVQLKPGTKSSAAAIKAAEATFSFTLQELQTAADAEIQNATNELVNKRISPADWVARGKAATSKKV
ncbi:MULTISPECIES: N-acetylglucosamine/diacetylchitobiose ABC transporter substrate-binding protein [Kitasatospora]|uniref:Putative chitobiose ABC transporter substrate-binding protein n=1 Tax=Kitasatospora setae (strain ATCC 33774 / DSM 43861 / JCM 3304 / KCC A-0304 / NBRC 14216 / KM-6054) TaxID=452652 RepID=E4NB72_KITSK|nr:MULTISPECIES: N-acetylglucosamine/diacetylchitobiose ABC transporter substrate-binding protein [Kitasatospora]BAJ28453.1 putative chitobiose ABC transporter substrate-binding protein [Kitasatospora setae KM-6054]